MIRTIERSRGGGLLGKFGAAAVMFFLIKGLVWVAVVTGLVGVLSR